MTALALDGPVGYYRVKDIFDIDTCRTRTASAPDPWRVHYAHWLDFDRSSSFEGTACGSINPWYMEAAGVDKVLVSKIPAKMKYRTYDPCPSAAQGIPFLPGNVEIPSSHSGLAALGHNGAGKSSILDGITWAVFDKARGGGDEIINSHSDAAEVIFDFDYEGARYRVQRSRPRGKTGLLEFYIRNDNERWRPLTDATIRATEAKIQKILRLDYETFINASFFLQGRLTGSPAEPGFTAENPRQRARLEIWKYRMQPPDDRTRSGKSPPLPEEQTYDEEIAREPEYLAVLSQLQNELANLDEALKLKAGALDLAVQQENLLLSLQKSLDEKTIRLQKEQSDLDELHHRLAERTDERESHRIILDQADETSSVTKPAAGRKHWKLGKALKSAVNKLRQQRSALQSVIDQKRAGLPAEMNALRPRQIETEKPRKEAPSSNKNLSGCGPKIRIDRAKREPEKDERPAPIHRIEAATGKTSKIRCG